MKKYQIRKDALENDQENFLQELEVAGSIMTLKEFDFPVLRSKACRAGGRHQKASEGNKKINRERTVQRVRRKIHGLVNCNISSSSMFLTLTFKENIEDVKEANELFKKFITKLSASTEKRQRYISVLERQGRGAIHYHCILFDLGFYPHALLADLWGNGFVWISGITSRDISEVTNIGAYLAKYVSKTSFLEGEKAYLCSKGLKRPTIYQDRNTIEYQIREGVVIKTGTYLQRNNVCRYAVMKKVLDKRQLDLIRSQEKEIK